MLLPAHRISAPCSPGYDWFSGNPFNSPNFHFPAGYVIEPIVGARDCAPLVVGALFVARTAPYADARILIWIALASSLAMLLSTPGNRLHHAAVRGRFSPARGAGGSRRFRNPSSLDASGVTSEAPVTAAFAVLVACSAIVNLALGIGGPYDQMLKSRTVSYLRIARWFSPFEQFRPMLNPKVAIDLTAEFKAQPDGFLRP